MVSLVLYAFLAVVAVGVLYALAVMVLPGSEQLAPPAPDMKPWSLPDEPLRAQDVIQMRLPVGVRGYRFAETDLLLDRLTEELRVREQELTQLRSQVGSVGSVGSQYAPDTAYTPEPSATAYTAEISTVDAAATRSSDYLNAASSPESYANDYSEPTRYHTSTEYDGPPQHGQ